MGLGVTDGRMTITVSRQRSRFRLGGSRPAGNGLENMRQRLEHIGGRLVLESEPGKGTRIRMEAKGWMKLRVAELSHILSTAV